MFALEQETKKYPVGIRFQVMVNLKANIYLLVLRKENM